MTGGGEAGSASTTESKQRNGGEGDGGCPVGEVSGVLLHVCWRIPWRVFVVVFGRIAPFERRVTFGRQS